MAWVNSCGGTRWDMLPDGTVAVEGRGVPVFEPGTLRFQQMQQTWRNWGALILDASSEYGVPAPWILAVMSQETGLWSADANEQAAKIAPDGGIGIMQIMPATGRGFGVTDPNDLLDPEVNVSVGVELLAKLSKLRGGQLPEVVATYNSGRVCAPGRNEWNLMMSNDYAGNVIRWNNSAVIYLDMSRRHGPILMGLALGAGGLYAAAVIAGLMSRPRFIGGRA